VLNGLLLVHFHLLAFIGSILQILINLDLLSLICISKLFLGFVMKHFWARTLILG